MPRNQPKALTGMVGATDIAIIGAELLIVLLQPEIGVPATLTTLLLALARGQTLLQYLALVKDVAITIDTFLDILVKLKQLGLFGETEDCCEQLKRIADYLRVEVDGMPDKSYAEIMDKIQHDLVWTDTDGNVIPLGESLGRLIFTGYFSSERQP